MQTPSESSMTQVNWVEALDKLPPLGLKLDKAKSFTDWIQERLYPFNESSMSTKISSNVAEPSPEREPLKVSKIGALLLKIGPWQRVSRNEEDVVAKIFFAKRRLVWEILENGLKKKIEIQWEHILSMRVVLEDYQPGILEVELSQPPTFFLEKNPEPRKHSRWTNILDFTDGPATTCRRHFLKFPPRAIDKHLQKLLQFEPRFLQMLQSPFPFLHDPYFRLAPHNVRDDISFINFNGNPQEINSLLQSPYPNDHFNNVNVGSSLSFGCDGNGPNIDSFHDQPFSNDPPMPLSHVQGHQDYQSVSSFPFDDCSPTSVMDLSLPLDEIIPYNGVERTQSMGLWDQQMNNFEDITQEHMMIQGQFSSMLATTFQESPIAPHQNNTVESNYNEQGLHNLPSLAPPMYNENQLPNPNYSNMDLDAAIAVVSTGTIDYGHQRVANDNIGGQLHPQTMSWATLEDKWLDTNFGLDKAMEDISGNQIWFNPENNF